MARNGTCILDQGQIMQAGSDDEGDFDPDLSLEIQDREDEGELLDDVPVRETGDSEENNTGTFSPAPVDDDEDSEHIEDASYAMETDGDETVDDDVGLPPAPAVDTDQPWVRNLDGFPMVPKFAGTPGIKAELGDDPQPIEVYREIIDDRLLSMIEKQTNKYAEDNIAARRQQGPLDPRTIFSTWKKVTAREIRNFLAICLHMGLVKKPQIRDYWSLHAGLHSSYAAQIMSRDRFTSILAFLHLSDNDKFIPYDQEGHDPIHKIRPFLTHLQDKFEQLYVPTQDICVDEAMCPFKGRSRFRVYMKDKPTKWGFKFYELCECKSGYVFRLEMFCAERGVSNRPRDVVMRLMQPLLKKGYRLYMDNYYCEPGLCAELASQRTMVCGTVRKTRLQMPQELGQQDLTRGEMDYRRRGSVVACRWKDKQDVFMLSTFHSPQLQRSKGRFEDKHKPTAVIDYIANMARVDQSDQLISYFPMHRKSLKWWKKPFFHLLTLCTIQTMILLNKHRSSRNRKKMALEEVIKSLLLDLPVVRVDPATVASDGPTLPMSRLKARHFPSPIPPTPCRKKPRKNCYVCYQKLRASGSTRGSLRYKRPQTHYQCAHCKIGTRNVALCIHPCFEIYHTKNNFV